MKQIKGLWALACALGLAASLSGCGAAHPAGTPPPEAGSPAEPPASAAPGPSGSRAERTLEAMTLREKVGQLFLVRADALDLSRSQDEIDDPDAEGVTELTEEMRRTLRAYPVGGVVQFGKNLRSPAQITAFNRSLQEACPVPLLLCVDEEGGTVARLANHPAFALPQYHSAADVGARGDPREAVRMGSTIGAYLKEYGFHVDFAPVADVNTNPENPIIGSRAFSSDPQIAAALARGMADGLEQQGIMPVFKHFPGHGDTREDSHNGLAVTHRTEEEMERCEWLPFRQARCNEGVMVGHIAAPELTGTNTPASLSPQLVEGRLRGTLGFEGPVVTDSLSMKAITDSYSPGEAALAALRAGCDLLLMPADLQTAFDAVLAAVEEGSLSEERLDASVLRILACKEAQGLL